MCTVANHKKERQNTTEAQWLKFGERDSEDKQFHIQIVKCAFGKPVYLFSSHSDRFILYFLLTSKSYPLPWFWWSFNFIHQLFFFLRWGGLQDGWKNTGEKKNLDTSAATQCRWTVAKNWNFSLWKAIKFMNLANVCIQFFRVHLTTTLLNKCAN